MDLINKLRNQPERVRKIILWIMIVIVALILAIFWLYSSYWKIKEFKTEEFIEELNFPKVEIPTINE